MNRILLAIFLYLPLFSLAQPGKGGGNADREGRLKSLEIAYLTRELSITPAEAEKFWPVYNKYQDEMRDAFKSGKDGDVLERQQQMLDIRKKYKNDFNKTLGPDRTNKLFEAEVRFREMVRKELQQRKKQ